MEPDGEDVHERGEMIMPLRASDRSNSGNSIHGIMGLAVRCFLKNQKPYPNGVSPRAGSRSARSWVLTLLFEQQFDVAEWVDRVVG
jgi:hypothetical protein